jgi:hypothetical protein
MKSMNKKNMLPLMAVLAGSASLSAVQINEIRINEPGPDVNEYFELKGDPGESLDGLTYIVVGDHSNFGNPDDDAPFYGTGTIEYAFDLTGFSIPDDGYFLISESTITLTDSSNLDFSVSDLIFENSENVTHLLVRDYTGPVVEKDSDQWGESAVDLDVDDDGNVDQNLPWSEIVDGVGVVAFPNVTRPVDEDPDYSESLGVASVGPDQIFAPGHLFRNPFTETWDVGEYSLVGGLNVDSPGAQNSSSPVFVSFSPTVVAVGDSLLLTGSNFNEVENVEIGGQEAVFSVSSLNEIEVQVPENSGGGIVTIETSAGIVGSDTEVTTVPADKKLVFLEDFGSSLGEFLVVSVIGEQGWELSGFGGSVFAEMSGFDGAPLNNDDWLISPEIDLTNATEPEFHVRTAKKFGGPDLEVLVSSSYEPGVPDLGDWTELTVPLSQGDYNQVNSGPIDLSSYAGETVRIAFRYLSTDSEAASWQVHETYVTDLDAFSPDWDEDSVFGQVYRYSEQWSFSESVGYIFALDATWSYLPQLGYLGYLTGKLADGMYAILYPTALGGSPEYIFTANSFQGSYWSFTSGWGSFPTAN